LGIDVQHVRGIRRRAGARLALAGLAVGIGLLLGGCGGGGGEGDSGETSSGVAARQLGEKPATRDDAARFLTQATFGPTDADIDRVMALGYGGWIDDSSGRS
jgi:hypothetical protein